MGKDIHELRRLKDVPDLNPSSRRPTGWVPGGSARQQKIIEWRKRRARAMYRYTKEYLTGGQ